MKSEDDPPCSFIVDCAGLHEIASTQSNSVKDCCLKCLAKGIIGVPARVWQEFEELYEDEAEFLSPSVTRKIQMKKLYLLGAASIAERSNSSLSLSRYDSHSDLYAASICHTEGHTLLTTASHLAGYQRLAACTVAEIVGWAATYQP